MLAAVNPSGFALLPAYLSLIVLDHQQLPRQIAVVRAVRATIALTTGFAAVVLVFGLAVAPVAASVRAYLPAFTVVLGMVVTPTVDSALRYANVFKFAMASVIWSQLGRLERSPAVGATALENAAPPLLILMKRGQPADSAVYLSRRDRRRSTPASPDEEPSHSQQYDGPGHHRDPRADRPAVTSSPTTERRQRGRQRDRALVADEVRGRLESASSSDS